MSSHHLAELNVGTLRFPLDDPRMIDFTANLAPINALAERSPGYVWRLVDDSEVSATSVRPLGGDVIINLSVWTDVESLRNYVFRSGHLDFLRRRTDWFERPRPGEPSTVLWRVNGRRSTTPCGGCSCSGSTGRRRTRSRSGRSIRRPSPR